MLRDNATNPIHFDRFRIRTLGLCLALGLIPLTVMASDQIADSAAPTEEVQVPVSVEDPTTETESSAQGCPCCGRHGGGKGHSQGQAGQGRQGQGNGGQMRGAGRPEAQVIHFLVDNHESLERTVENIPGGVLTRTVSKDPEIIDAVRTHVRQMVDLIHGGGRIRNWDPLFREIFDHREAIEMQITDIEGGVEVTETSEDDQVAKLIRAHAVKVEEFVARGLDAYKEETPLPEDYSETRP